MIKSYFNKNTIIVLLLFLFVFILPYSLSAADSFAKRLSGKILLQVEFHGEAWYINPADLKKYYLGRPSDAFDLMRKLSIGISNKDLEKIPIGVPANNYPDSDADGLYDYLEDAIGTDKNNQDTDSDGYDDKTELTNGYNPLGPGKQLIDKNFTKTNSGKIFLQVEKYGQAWYVEPITQKRYFLGRPDDAFKIMQTFGLGIINTDLEKISVGLLPITIITPPINPIATTTEDNIIYLAANAIRAKNKTLTASYFVPEMKKSIEYNLDNMSDESILALGNILSGSKLTSSTTTEKIYSNEVYFSLGGYDVTLKFNVEKQPDGNWLITNL